MKKLSKYSIGMGDRFAHQASAQLKAVMSIEKLGFSLTPVWNKSNREHNLIGSHPTDTRAAVDIAIKKLGWSKPYYIDADHINIETVDRFMESSDFFTIDVASYIGKNDSRVNGADFKKKMQPYTGMLNIPGIANPLEIDDQFMDRVIGLFMYAAFMAGETYKKIEMAKGKGNFITEVSMDEVSSPQSPAELFFILAMLSYHGVPVQTIAPKFTGRFNKGVDYEGNREAFATEFEDNLMVIDHAISCFDLPSELKLSIHSGSDKFSIYGDIKRLTSKHGKGFHLKTAGTTWIEEVIGLSLAGGEALEFVKALYKKAFQNIEKLSAPYADVISIDNIYLPLPEVVNKWEGDVLANALRHEPNHPGYNSNMRQLIHVSFKLAAEDIEKYNRLLEKNEQIIANCVFENIHDRHLKRLLV